MLSDQETSLRSFHKYSDVEYTEEEWAIAWVGIWAFLCNSKREAKEALQFDPKRSVLYGDHPELLKHACDTEVPIIYDPSIREFGVSVLDGGYCQMSFRFDPWSGKPLPTSLRDEWFEAIEALGIDPWNDKDKTPARFNDETWWKDSYVSEKSA
ncbi:DUF6980 family protein [Microvirga mediterraneensis]|uniref:DUF6980 domain-containing protein n=1 Tax=Microvirga mediterraneensis TaxID=2754695 RepID=A0A838BPL9_9HYPH|nr:hypothetical protein [Microvirga mediterraneensis]MBA1157340.1 hypothetical protein [Microvirga mediterraneensis]